MRLYDNQPSGTVDRARQLRRAASPIEHRLLRGLRGAFPHLKWRHQAPVGPVPFYADVLCFSERLVIEIDGDSHANAEEYDARRTASIESEGYRVVRFTNGDVMSNLAGVLTAIAEQLISPSPLRGCAALPLSRRERGPGAPAPGGEGDPRPNEKGEAA